MSKRSWEKWKNIYAGRLCVERGICQLILGGFHWRRVRKIRTVRTRSLFRNGIDAYPIQTDTDTEPVLTEHQKLLRLVDDWTWGVLKEPEPEKLSANCNGGQNGFLRAVLRHLLLFRRVLRDNLISYRGIASK